MNELLDSVGKEDNILSALMIFMTESIKFVNLN